MTRLTVLVVMCASVTTHSGAMSVPPEEYSRASAPGIVIEASAWSKVTVASTVPLRVTVRTESGMGLEWPGALVVGGELGGLTIARVRDLPDAIDPDGALVTAREFYLEPFLPGAATIGPLEFVARDGSGERRTLLLGPMTVTVTSVLPDASRAEVSEPMGVVELAPEQEPRWGVVAIGAGAAVIVAGGAALLIARRGSRREPVTTPSQRALAALALLDERVRGGSGMGARPTSDEAYTTLSSILRGYLEDRFEVRTSVLTTEEFFAHATTRSSLPQDATDALRPLLAACDEVKFGAAEPGLRAAGDAIDQIRAFVGRFGDAGPERGGAS